jgi:hypothetical protein
MKQVDLKNKGMARSMKGKGTRVSYKVKKQNAT